jgi:hypothetical protein
LIQPGVPVDMQAAGARTSGCVEAKSSARQMLQSEKFPYFITKVFVVTVILPAGHPDTILAFCPPDPLEVVIICF